MSQNNQQVNLFDPEIAFETFMPDAEESVAARGFEQIAVFARGWLARWRDYGIVGDEVREVAPGKVFVACRQMARGHSSGVEVGRGVGRSLHYDRTKAFEAAGLRE